MKLNPQRPLGFVIDTLASILSELMRFTTENLTCLV